MKISRHWQHPLILFAVNAASFVLPDIQESHGLLAFLFSIGKDIDITEKQSKSTTNLTMLFLFQLFKSSVAWHAILLLCKTLTAHLTQ